MRPLRNMNEWVTSKIAGHLAHHEGFTRVAVIYQSESVRTILEDAFGFRYEIEVKTVGRTQALPEGDFEKALVEFRHSGAV